jgi:septal ring factor EnvC (AmiA/AmiB activator)
VGVLAALGLTLGLAATAATPAGEDRREAELRRLRDEIAGLQGRLNVVRREQAGVEGELRRTELELALLERQIAEAAAARDLAASRAEASERRIGELERGLSAVRGDLRRRLAGLYRLGRHGYLRLFLAVDREQRLLPAIRQLRYLARRDAGALDTFTDLRARLAVEREELLAQRQASEAWLEREGARRRELAGSRARQAALLAGIRREQRTLVAREAELVERERKLANFLDLLYGRNPALAGRPIQSFRGVLDWPVDGQVVQRFGPRLDPRYGTRVPHNGVDIQPTAAGSPVRAVFPGQVVFAAPFAGYGQTVVLNHAGRVMTLYAGLSAVGVGEGEVVSLGGELGRANSKIYFEIRVENRPQDPLVWLR